MLVNKLFNKTTATYAAGALCVAISYCVQAPTAQYLLAQAGYFSLVSSLTNWLAIQMLFEKIPFLVGSGVIETRFEGFKMGLKRLVMEEFFTEENIAAVLSKTSLNQEKLLEIADKINYDKMVQHLEDAILATKLGSMLALVGGQSMIGLVKEPLKEKLRQAIVEMLAEESLQAALLDVVAHHHGRFVETITQIVDHHLSNLTPLVVKEIIQNMIRQHLGWLIVWGGVFGGLLGALTALMSK